jgi:SAM-dependent MidA family methyltransferase
MIFHDLGRPRDNEALKDVVLERIGAAGAISFAEFMDLALYHPRFGYYRTCDPSLDFQTSPEVHPIFAACIGQTLGEMWRLMDRPARFDVFEAGAGTGRLAAGIIRRLHIADPDFAAALRYGVSDPRLTAPDALEMLEKNGVPMGSVTIHEDLPGEIEGCILSNELLDALPFRRVRVQGGRLEEILVAAAGRELVDLAATPPEEIISYFRVAGRGPGEGCGAEINLAARDWMRAAVSGLGRGYILTFDYGYPAAELYAPWRTRGTLLTFHRMSSGEDPYVRLGLQDVTASVDFTSVAAAAEAAGSETLAFSSQHRFLEQAGIRRWLAETPLTNIEGFYGLRQAVLTLSDPAGLGRIRVLLQGKGVPRALPAGFEAGTSAEDLSRLRSGASR